MLYILSDKEKIEHMKDKAPGLVKDDPWLKPYSGEITNRIERFKDSLEEIRRDGGNLMEFASAYKTMGINYDHDAGGWWYREWAPAARALFLCGDFNNWDRTSHPLKHVGRGNWEIFLPGETLSHGSLVKVHVITDKNSLDRIPAYIRRVIQDPQTHEFKGQIWQPVDPYQWKDEEFSMAEIKKSPIIYEAHIGMAQEKEGVGTYREFMENILPRVYDLGYNVLQLMAIQEHPYYGSFGYHVSNFFAPTSRFGTPDEFKELVDRAHSMGIGVIIDLVHSHCVKNISEGLNEFDGSENQYFHPGGRGYHQAWDSKLFDYGKREVKQFLLSNVRYWLEEFHIDGFRFDGITSMMYFHHGDLMDFDHYDKYFVEGIDWDALLYLQLANALSHELRGSVINVAEDMSGMPGLCRSIIDGGVGFDFRLGMGIPDFWIKYLKEKRDEDWDIHEMWGVMTNRRWKEKTVAYTESHDQAIVGDKTIAFWLMDKEMYFHMQKDDNNIDIDRGLALHKLIRLFTASLGGEAYLNFIGNEYGHPEWIDFPREGNGWSYKYARRQWSLVDNEDLKYHYLNDFDRALIYMLKAYNILSSQTGEQLNMDTENKVIIFKRGNLIFLFNFHNSHSISDYRFHTQDSGTYRIVLNSDSKKFGGFGRVDSELDYRTIADDMLSIYLPNRTALVMERVNK